MKVQLKKSRCSQEQTGVLHQGFALTCLRDDGSSSWYRPQPAQASHFAIHDLTHFAVESELAELEGFFTLVANGWQISEFESAASNNRAIPEDALLVEWLVGQLDAERASGQDWTVEQLNHHFGLYAKLRKSTVRLVVQQDQLDTIRQHRDVLIQQWTAVPEGEILELIFTAITNREER